MPGNDLIWLDHAREARWEHRIDVLKKILTPTEADWFLTLPHRFMAIWALWAAKEAAYKAYQRRFHRPFNNPKNIDLTAFEESKEKRFECRGRIYSFETEITIYTGRHFIYAFATAPDSPPHRHLFYSKIQENQFEAHASEYYQRNLHLRKDQRNHPILQDEAGKKIEISKTHDGPLTAFSIPVK